MVAGRCNFLEKEFGDLSRLSSSGEGRVGAEVYGEDSVVQVYVQKNQEFVFGLEGVV